MNITQVTSGGDSTQYVHKYAQYLAVGTSGDLFMLISVNSHVGQLKVPSCLKPRPLTLGASLQVVFCSH